MGDLLGIGLSHAPMFQFPDENMADILRSFLKRESIPAEVRAMDNWPKPMRAEWGSSGGPSQLVQLDTQLPVGPGLRPGRSRQGTR